MDSMRHNFVIFREGSEHTPSSQTLEEDMKHIVLTVTAALGLALPTSLLAATEADTNGDGVLTIDEVQALYPDITVEQFTAMHVNADGALDDDEVVAAQEAGMMPPTEG
jgi:hypothetical protein